MENKEFEMPKVDVIQFASEDIITASGDETPIAPVNTVLK